MNRFKLAWAALCGRPVMHKIQISDGTVTPLGHRGLVISGNVITNSKCNDHGIRVA